MPHTLPPIASPANRPRPDLWTTLAAVDNPGSTRLICYGNWIKCPEHRLERSSPVHGKNALPTETVANASARMQQLNGLTEKGDDPRRGVTGVVGGSGSGGVEPNPLSGHGGCNRRGSRMVHGLNQR
jgi:hypothetical protein